MISLLTDYATAASGSDYAIARDSLKIPAVPANQITLVTNSTTCSQLKTAYQTVLQGQGQGGFTNSVYVVKLGTTSPKFAVCDPGYVYWKPIAKLIGIFDAQGNRISWLY